MKALVLAVAAGFLGLCHVSSKDVAVDRAGEPIPNLSDAEKATFAAGKPAFNRVWSPHGNPGFFNGRSCVSCHQQPSFGGASDSPFNVVFFVPDAKEPTGFKPHPWLVFENGRPSGQRLPYGDYEVRRPMALYGLGLLEVVPIENILAKADPSDKNKDGISGRLIKVDDRYGRFGWRASTSTLAGFVRSAFETEMGLELGKGQGRNLLTPEIVHGVAETLRMLAPPKPRAVSEAGKLVFDRIGCAGCHTPTQQTGYSEYPALKDKVIAPYSDLLVHDVGRGKGSVATGPRLTKGEFRTAPLWGLGLTKGPYWHDGSTETLEDAVDRHEGEGLSARDKWRKLSKTDRDALLKFLRSL